MIILGIETSCDETSAAIIEGDKNKPFVTVLSNISSTSLQLHAKTGGIIPEIAAREQIKDILPVIKQALAQAYISKQSVDAIAVTYGPGLIGSLLVGVETAKTLSFVWNKPVIQVNHLLGHMYANWINPSYLPLSGEQISPSDKGELKGVAFPAVALIVSGGHTDLILIKKHGNIVWLGGTRDDAAGEAIDKIGRTINLPYPSGPEFEQAATKGDPKRFRFPRPLMHDHAYDFSFSGLKTAALREIQKHAIDQQTINDIARGVQDAIIDVLVYKTTQAAEEYQVKSILLSGGVAANQALRDTMQRKITEKQLSATLYAPEKKFCTDNAAMIATAGLYIGKKIAWKMITANPELYFDCK